MKDPLDDLSTPQLHQRRDQLRQILWDIDAPHPARQRLLAEYRRTRVALKRRRGAP